MRTVAWVPVVAALLACQAAGASEPTEPPPLPPPEQHTVVRGTPPADRDVAGRWMVVGWIELPDGKVRTTPALWEIERGNGQLVLTVRFAALPSDQQRSLDDANSGEHAWRPSPLDVAQLAAAWDTLSTSDPRLVSVDNEIVGRDGFDQSFTSEVKTRDAAWVVRQSERFHPSASPAMQSINVYAVLEPREGGYFGNFTTATIAAAPLPIPITLNGTFQMYRLGTAPRRFLARVMDFFRGCGRS